MNKYKEYSKVKQSDLYKRTHKPGTLACSKKRSFETRKAATRFIERTGYKLKVYSCKICYLFHTASITNEGVTSHDPNSQIK